MMGVDSLLKEVEEKRSKALGALEREYGAKADEIRKKTEEQVTYISSSAEREAADLSQKETIKIQGASRLQAKRILLDATEGLLESNISFLRQELAGFAESQEYQQLLPKMARYASEKLGGDISVVCRKQDEAALRAAGAKIAAADLGTIGGFKAENSEETLELDLTFEEIIRSRDDDIRAAILGKE